MRYIVEDVVCDYGVFDSKTHEMLFVFNSLYNAEIVCEILNEDDKHKTYKDLKLIEQAFLLACEHLSQLWMATKLSCSDWKNLLLDKAIEKESDLK